MSSDNPSSPRSSSQRRSPLIGAALQRAILVDYPQPIAAAYRALLISNARDNICLVRLGDALLHFLAAVALGSYLRSSLDNTKANAQILQILLADKWSTGTVLCLLRTSLATAASAGTWLPDGLAAFLGEQHEGASGQQRLDRIVQLRNDLVHHGTRCEAELRAEIEVVLALVPALARVRLVRPIVLEGRMVRSADLLRGELPLPDDFSFRVERADLDHEFAPIKADRDSLVLVSPDGRSYLPLFPLARFTGEPPATWFFQGGDWNTEGPRALLRRAAFCAFSEGAGELADGPGEYACRCLEQQVARLQQRMPAEQRVAVARAVAQERPARDPYQGITGLREEQRQHLHGFVGREQDLARLAAWIDSSDGRYLLVLGPPGQGKSALMARLAEREEARGGCLLHMVKSHPSPRRFLPALLGQAAALAQTTFGAPAYTGSIDDLRDNLVKGLRAVVQKTGRAVLVLDALDELDGEGRLATFLPPALPEGVRVVLTCRPDIPLVQTLRTRLAGRLDEQMLGPLDLADFRCLLEGRLEAAAVTGLCQQVGLEALFARVGGNPLYLTCFLADTAQRWGQARQRGEPFRVVLDEVPATLEAVFDKVCERVAEGPDGRLRERLLHLLCQAREPLALEPLTELLAAAGQPVLLGECRARLREMSQYLLDMGGGRYKPWHQGLTDHVRRHVLGAAGVCQVEEVFCRWMASGGGGRYALRHRVRHQLAAGQADQASALLTDLAELEARAEAGLVFELAGDFKATVKALPEGKQRRTLELLEEGLRRDIHFVARHPQALFQCLWNSAWWYDCPEAAGYYAEGRSPGQEAGLGLHLLLEGWRAAREQQRPDLVWLRSLRPPAMHLGTAQRDVFRGHADSVNSVEFSPDGRRILSGSYDKTVCVWDSGSGQQLLCLTGHENWVWSVAFSPDGRRVLSGSGDKTVRVWDSDSGQQLLCLTGHEDPVLSVAFSPDGRRILSGSNDDTVRVWDSNSGQQLLCLTGHEDWVYSVAFSPDGRRVLSGSDDKTVRVWDSGSGQQLLCLTGHEDWVRSVAFSPDGRRILSGSHDKTVRVWDSDSGQQLLCLTGHEDWVRSVAFSPDDRRVLSGSTDKTVRVWDSDSRQQLLCLIGHTDWVRSVAFSPDARRVLSGSDDKTVRVWDSNSGQQLLCLTGHEHWVSSVAFSPDARRVLSGSTWDKTVRVWDALSGECLEILPGQTDVATVAGGATPLPWRPVSHDLETAIESAASAQPVAWFAQPVRGITNHSSGRTWAGIIGSNYLCLFTLEGRPPG